VAQHHRPSLAALCDRVMRELGRGTARLDDVVIMLVRRGG
jgi:hypothetical protein